MSGIKDKLGKELLFFDGAFGTQLQAMGYVSGESPENMNITDPQVIYGIHKGYVDAGASIILANTFGANKLKLRGSYSVPEVINAGVKIARKAIQDSGREAYVSLDIGSTGKLVKPFGDLEFEEAYEAFSEMVRAGVEAGVDLVSIETMMDIYETKAAILAVKENSDLPLTVTVSFGGPGRMLTGATPAVAATVISSLGADAIGINCGMGPAQCVPLLTEMRKYTSLPLVINPNAGMPVLRDGKTFYDVDATEFASQMRQTLDEGAALLGGCCGTTPGHIRALTEACFGMQPSQNYFSEKKTVCVSSYSKAINVADISDEIRGEMDPQKDAELAEALRNHDMEYVESAAMDAEEDGIEILRISANIPQVDEAELLFQMIKTIQGVSSIVLEIDAYSPEAIEKGLRAYNGRPLASVDESRSAWLLPLIEKHGAIAYKM